MIHQDFLNKARGRPWENRSCIIKVRIDEEKERARRIKKFSGPMKIIEAGPPGSMGGAAQAGVE
jgi:hypothetical protein